MGLADMGISVLHKQARHEGHFAVWSIFVDLEWFDIQFAGRGVAFRSPRLAEGGLHRVRRIFFWPIFEGSVRPLSLFSLAFAE